MENEKVNPADYRMAVFRGWFTSPTPTDGQYSFDFDTLITEDVTLYAIFSDSYLISYKDTEGKVIQTDKVSPGKRIYGPTQETVDKITPPQGMRLDYWYEETQGPEIPYNFDLSSSVAERDMTFRPAFTNTYLVIFLSDGSEVDAQVVANGKKATKPTPSPTRDGYRFIRWYKQGEDDSKAFDFKTPITENTVLVAKWEARNDVSYTVALWMEKANISGTPSSTQDYNYITSVPLTGTAGEMTNLNGRDLPFAIDGYFTGWYNTILKYGAFSCVENKTIQGHGLTVVNLYANRKTYTYTFNLGSEEDRTMTIGGKTYTGGKNAEKYTLKVKYEMEISKVFPVQGVPDLFQFSKGFSSWQPPNSMVTGAGIASIRKIVDSSLLSSKGQTLHYTLTANWKTNKKEYPLTDQSAGYSCRRKIMKYFLSLL